MRKLITLAARPLQHLRSRNVEKAHLLPHLLETAWAWWFKPALARAFVTRGNNWGIGRTGAGLAKVNWENPVGLADLLFGSRWKQGELLAGLELWPNFGKSNVLGEELGQADAEGAGEKNKFAVRHSAPL